MPFWGAEHQHPGERFEQTESGRLCHCFPERYVLCAPGLLPESSEQPGGLLAAALFVSADRIRMLQSKAGVV